MRTRFSVEAVAKAECLVATDPRNQIDPPMNQLIVRSLGGVSNRRPRRRLIPPTHGTAFPSDSRSEIEKKIVVGRLLMLAVGAVACFGTILALFAWTGANL